MPRLLGIFGLRNAGSGGTVLYLVRARWMRVE